MPHFREGLLPESWTGKRPPSPGQANALTGQTPPQALEQAKQPLKPWTGKRPSSRAPPKPWTVKRPPPRLCVCQSGLCRSLPDLGLPVRARAGCRVGAIRPRRGTSAAAVRASAAAVVPLRQNGAFTTGHRGRLRKYWSFYWPLGAHRGGHGVGGAVPERGVGALSECGAGDRRLCTGGQHVRILQRRHELHGAALQRFRSQPRWAARQPAFRGRLEPDAHGASRGCCAHTAGGALGEYHLCHRRGSPPTESCTIWR